MIKIPALFALLVLMVGSAQADFDSPFEVTVPEYMQSLNTAQELAGYLNSGKEAERIAACMRLGQIRGEEAYQLLVTAFDKEPFRKGIELPDGVRYYALIGIGQSGVQAAEPLLSQIVTDYSRNIHESPDTHISADSLSVIRGALGGLYEIQSDSATAHLNSTFNNGEYYWVIRYLAYINIIKLHLRTRAFPTESDTASYLITNLAKLGPGSSMWNEDHSVNVDFIKSAAYRQLLFEYKDSTLPELSRYISGLRIGDPAVPYLDSLRKNMEGKPLH
jgi:hypothetical protein